MSAWSSVLAKYDVPVPRYTSYPTVPYWAEMPTADQWIQHLRQNLGPQKSWSMYIHIPFCETLCTFCGCNTIITRDHKNENSYVDLVKKEWALYQQKVPELQTSLFRHIHLGGGTPTFLSSESLRSLLEPIFSNVNRAQKNFEASVEVDPRRTSKEQLQTLHKIGFNRVSMGIQDFNPEVQKLVNRLQPFEITEALTHDARAMGYDSVNFDLIYGLAKQTEAGMEESVKQTLQLRPDRIALYSFALVPWIKPAQRLFKDEDLPKAEEKRKLYEVARGHLLAGGYVEVGMDHFALPTDNLARAMKQHELHRNFMGYTDQQTDVMLGLGVSSISETPDSFHQNEKLLPKYEAALATHQIPGLRGHVLSEEDKVRRQQILKLMTEYEVQFESPAQESAAKDFLHEMMGDGLVELSQGRMRVTDAGRPFLRNACLFFDERLKRNRPEARIFSQSI